MDRAGKIPDMSAQEQAAQDFIDGLITEAGFLHAMSELGIDLTAAAEALDLVKDGQELHTCEEPVG